MTHRSQQDAEVTDSFPAQSPDTYAANWTAAMLAAQAAADRAEDMKSWIKDLQAAADGLLRIVVIAALAAALGFALIAFARVKIEEVRAMPRYVEGME